MCHQEVKVQTRSRFIRLISFLINLSHQRKQAEVNGHWWKNFQQEIVPPMTLKLGLPTVPVHIWFTATIIQYPVLSRRGSEVSRWWYGFQYGKLPVPYRIRYAAKPYLRAVYYVWWNWMFNLRDLNFMLAVTQSTASMAHHLKAPRVYGCYSRLCISCQCVRLYTWAACTWFYSSCLFSCAEFMYHT